MCQHLQPCPPDSRQKIPLISVLYSKRVVAHDGDSEGLRRKVICCLVFLTQTSWPGGGGRILTASRADVLAVLSTGAAAKECWQHPGVGSAEQPRGREEEG